ncbi:MAG: bifunctional diaminohydroxyphosphoribosylaminopyrimidine deaminase/5-amino-6-(5-phosphoribosylamino)uracil reductase RibD [Saprospiraceae bacterium]|nr:bifunctional diaminohydroxyphosphoribosylaminopyrimidine deaminase/5-amino-6-(5-phosphoribosylamino)uracil reductase RibD [Saprospiraceae bacterium]
MQDNHDIYFKYCLELARRSSMTKTNPSVGALLRYEDQVIGEGWHGVFGGPHAEVNAIRSVPQALRKYIPLSTMYISLEPCNHFGKTPPCTDLILQSGIKNVMIGCTDPNPKMSGKSIQYLESKGVQIQLADNPADFLKLIHPFYIRQSLLRPYIILKWAESLDGLIGRENEKVKISNAISDILVHKWRSQVDGILVGSKTYINDIPQLNVRHWTGGHPKKYIISHSQNISEFTTLPYPGLNIVQSLKKVYEEEACGSLLVEGGRETLQYFIDRELWDEARIVKNHGLELKSGISAPLLRGKLEASWSFLSDDWFVIKP